MRPDRSVERSGSLGLAARRLPLRLPKVCAEFARAQLRSGERLASRTQDNVGASHAVPRMRLCGRCETLAARPCRVALFPMLCRDRGGLDCVSGGGRTMSNPPGGNGAPNYLNLNLGVGVGGLQGNFPGASRGDAPPVVALAHILRRVRGREENVGRQERMPCQSNAHRTRCGWGCRRTGGSAAGACARAGKPVRPAAEMPAPHCCLCRDARGDNGRLTTACCRAGARARRWRISFAYYLVRARTVRYGLSWEHEKTP